MLRPFFRFIAALSLTVLFATNVRADEMDDRYLTILSTLDQAEELQLRGNPEQSRARYQAAQKALLELKAADPTWKSAMVAHRLTAIAERLRATSPRPADAARPNALPSNSTSSVKLLAAGAEPRRALRLRPKAGTVSQGLITVQTAMTMAMAGTQMPSMDMPAMKIPVTTRVESVSDNGEIHYTTTIGEVDVAASGEAVPGMGDAMRASVSQLKGATTSARMDSRGNVTTAAVAQSAGQGTTQSPEEQVNEALSDFAVPYPEELIGIGAKWECQRVIRNQGLTLNQTSVYELMSLTNDRAELKVTLRQTAANQKIASSMMAGMDADLQKLTGSGDGRIVVDPSRLLPLSGEVSSKTDMQMGMNVAGQAQSMEMSITSKSRLEAK